MISHQDLRRLSYFAAVARAGSIRGAADALRLSPAVVSDALARLEEGLGVTLLTRSTRSMRLTAVGERVLARAADMVSAGEEALRLGRGVAEVPSGPLRLTLPGELCLSWLPCRLRAFEAAFPEVAVVAAIDDSLAPLEQSAFDIAIRATYARAPREGADVLGCVPLDCVCAPALLRSGEALEAALERIGVIGRAGAEVGRRTLSAGLRSKGRTEWTEIAAPCRFHASEHVVGHRLAVEGFGAALLMRPTIEADVLAGRLAPVSDAHEFGHVVVTIKLRDAHPTAAARALRAALADARSIAADPPPARP